MKKKWERAKDILFVVICVYVFVRIALPEQYQAMDFRLLGMLDEKYPSVANRVRQGGKLLRHILW